MSSYWNNAAIAPPTCTTPVESVKSSPPASPIRSPFGSPVVGSPDEKSNNFQSSVVPPIYQQVLTENVLTLEEEKHHQSEEEEMVPKISKVESLAKSSPTKSKLKGKNFMVAGEILNTIIVQSVNLIKEA